MKLALACSAGGHLTELLQLREAYERFDHFYVTFSRPDSQELQNAYYIDDPKRSPMKILKNMFQRLKVFIKERPDVVITTGAGVVVPFCLISKIFGKKIVYIESFCRISEPSFTGRIMYYVSDIFLVQWKDILKEYGAKARFWGSLL